MDKIICVGKNYLEHAKELGDKIPEKPVLFLKPPSVLKQAQKNGETIQALLPAGQGSVHHECEIVVQLKGGGYRLDAARAKEAIGAVTLGLDMTLRDLQATLKKNGHPWTTAKVFPDSALIGPWQSVETFPKYSDEVFSFSIDGEKKQAASARDMMMGIPECIAFISEHFPLCPGDVLFTGTPKGVGPVSNGQRGELKYGPIHYYVSWAHSS
jgi:2-keto-4-pentenoate hydratase/2-oxohepta-3-ene-1,7-dioic acid hydratase in catechol pathway